MGSMHSGKYTRWPEGGITAYVRRNRLIVNRFKCVQKRSKIMELTYCVEQVTVEVGNIVKCVNLDTRSGYGVHIYIKAMRIFLAVMYLLVGALIVMSILQYGLVLALRFALVWLLLDVYGSREFQKGTGCFKIWRMLAWCPLLKAEWLKIYKILILYIFGHFLPRQM